MFKVVMKSNFNIHAIEERIAIYSSNKLENLTDVEAKIMCALWNKLNADEMSTYYATIEAMDYVLWQGTKDMEELV
jgi:hypothetical protein